MSAAARFTGSQVAGNSQVTFSVPVLSPPVLYKWLMPGLSGSQKKDSVITRPLRSDAMNGKTGGNRGPRCARALVAVAAVAALATACSIGNAQQVVMAYGRCMRSHGVPNFPEPVGMGQGPNTNAKWAGVNTRSPQFLAAASACQHVLRRGSTIQYSEP
jgi:hypothetical protein